MISIAVLCKNVAEQSSMFCVLVNKLRNSGFTLNRLIWHQCIVGNKKCRVRFYSSSDESAWVGSKFDLTMGFSVKQQKDILKEGCRTSRKFVEFKENYVDILAKYFE